MRSTSEAIDLSNRDDVLKHLVVPDTLQARRGEFADAIVSAHDVMHRFATQHGWQAAADRIFICGIEVVRDESEMRERVGLTDTSPIVLETPSLTLMAGVHEAVLLALPPEQCANLRPEYATTPDHWARLLAHELVHELHLQIIDGRDEEMGPRWFFEGFAVIGSGQGYGEDVAFESADAALQSVHPLPKRQAYRRAAEVLRYFLKFIKIELMVDLARRSDFESQLKTLVDSAQGGQSK